MAIDQTWTDPSTGGDIDLDTDDVLPEVVWDKVISNLKRLGGTTGPTNVQATRGAFPSSGYVMGAVGHDRHVESGVNNVDMDGDPATSPTFTVAFVGAPNVTLAIQADADYWVNLIGAPSTTGFTMKGNGGSGTSTPVHWIACGA